MNDASADTRDTPAQSKRREPFSALHGLYALAFRLIGPLLPGYLRRRARAGKEDPGRLTERFGVASAPRAPGKLVWIHGASVGESLSALPLLERLLARDPDLQALITTGTVTSANLLKDRLPPRAVHQFIPLDHPVWVERFLDHWRPDAVLWLESEFWPSMLAGIRRRAIPAALVNSRLSDASFARWQRMPGTIARILATFQLALPKDDDVAQKLEFLGAPVSLPILKEGNLKLASLPLPDRQDDRLALETKIGQRPVVIAAQSVEGEEGLLARVFETLTATVPNLLIILIPKHPGRADEIENLLCSHGLNVAVRSRGELPGEETAFYLGDTMGELGLFYRLDGPVVLGRSLVPGFGGSNPLEPARFGRCILQGPYTENFSEETKMLATAKASLVAADEAELTALLQDVLANKPRAQALGAAAKTIVHEAQSVLERYEKALTPLLPSPAHPKRNNHNARA